MAVTMSSNSIRMTASGDSTTSVFTGIIHARAIHIQNNGSSGTVTITTDNGDTWWSMTAFPGGSSFSFVFGNESGLRFTRDITVTMPASCAITIDLA